MFKSARKYQDSLTYKLLLMASISRFECESADGSSGTWSFIFMMLCVPIFERSCFPGVALVDAWMFGNDSLRIDDDADPDERDEDVDDE